MAPKTLWTDEYTLLCERCGYVVEGLATDGACPECGKPISESLPERRVGTPWQQKPSFRNLLKTWWMTLRHPKRTLDVMRMHRESSSGLLGASLLLFLALAWVSLLAVWAHFVSEVVSFIAVFFGTLVFAVFGVGIAAVLIATERAGLRFLGRKHGLRITPDASSSICSHGSIGWAFVAAGLGFANTGAAQPGLLWVAGLAVALIGFLFFEWFAWLGLRRCKYANRARTGSGASNPSTPHP
ncbi:MAG: hypothetical protein AAF356_04140 [Planctomycetota bacterium]